MGSSFFFLAMDLLLIDMLKGRAAHRRDAKRVL